MWSTERLPLAAVLAAGVAVLGACASAPPVNGRVEQPLTPLDQYPVRAVARTEDLMLAVHPRGGLSPAQESALAGFASTWRDSGGASAVVVSQPASGGPDAQLTAQGAADRLVALGVPPAALRIGTYDAGGDPAAPVTARFEHLAAAAPDCDSGWTNLVSTNDNKVTGHFGCANARNFAVMLADPRDLRDPRATTPADAGRRATVLESYRRGVVTSSAKDDQANGAISAKVK